jgi:hypothetical protein
VKRAGLAKAAVSGYVAGGVACWIVSLYVYVTGDPTHLLITSRFSGAPLRPENVALGFFWVGIALLFIAAIKRYVLPR